MRRPCSIVVVRGESRFGRGRLRWSTVLGHGCLLPSGSVRPQLRLLASTMDDEPQAFQLSDASVGIHHGIDGRWRLVNRLTNEVVELGEGGGGEWELCWSDTGDGFLCRAGGDAQWLTDGIFSLTVFEQGAGDTLRFLIARAGDDLDSALTREAWYNEHVICECPLAFDIGPQRKLIFAKFERQGLGIFNRCSLSSLFDIAGWGMFNDVDNKWCQHSLPRWDQVFQRMQFGDGHLLRSFVWGSRVAAPPVANGASPGSGPGIVLQFVSDSCPGLLLILSQMACGKARVGGCATPLDWAKSERILHALLKRFQQRSAEGQLKLNICLKDFRAEPPPGSTLCGSCVAPLFVRSGEVHAADLQVFAEKVQRELGGVEQLGFGLDGIPAAPSQPAPLFAMLKALAANGSASECLLALLCLALGFRLQGHIMAKVSSSSAAGVASDRLRPGEAGDMAASCMSLGNMNDRSKGKWFNRYLASVVQLSENSSILSLAMDIGTIARQP